MAIDENIVTTSEPEMTERMESMIQSLIQFPDSAPAPTLVLESSSDRSAFTGIFDKYIGTQAECPS